MYETARKAEPEPICLVLSSLVDHFLPPSFRFGGLPPFFPFCRAISRSRSIPNLFKRAS